MFMKRAADVGEVPVETVMLSVCHDPGGKGDPKLRQQMSRDHFLLKAFFGRLLIYPSTPTGAEGCLLIVTYRLKMAIGTFGRTNFEIDTENYFCTGSFLKFSDIL